MPATMLVFINSYQDTNAPVNSPLLSNFKWTREVDGIDVAKAFSNNYSIPSGQTQTLFDGTRTLNQDGTTQYTLAPVGSNSYQLSWTGGASPDFRIPRNLVGDATTVVAVTVSGSVATFTSTGGTLWDLLSGGVSVGDQVTIGNAFAVSNRGTFQVLSVTPTSFSVSNPQAFSQFAVTLGISFASQVMICSAAGVQIGDYLNIFGGFSPASWGAYLVTAVQAESLTFYSAASLPNETIVTDQIVVYSAAKKLIYLEADQLTGVVVNGSAESNLVPFYDPDYVGPAILLKTSAVWSLQVTNLSAQTANYYGAFLE